MKNGVEVDKFGNKFYYLNGQFHREDGPALDFNLRKEWYQNGKRHRIGGPAVEWFDNNYNYNNNNNNEQWYQYGKLHRLDGPAIVYANGNKYWYYQGKQIDCNSQEEFEKLIKLKAFW